MITKRMESISATDLVLTNKLSKGFHRQPVSQPPSGSARRNLFGCLEDSAAINELLSKQASEMAERSSRHWNFDFIAGLPIPGGRYLWERVRVYEVPSLYKGDCDILEEASSVDCGQSTCSSSSFGEKENTLINDVRMDTEEIKYKIETRPRLLQTSIKGYAPVQKRRTSKRLQRSKNSMFIKGSTRVANYILDAGSSKKR